VTSVIIRPEKPADFDAIHALVTAAFSKPAEAELVELIRASAHYVPDLALVAESARQIVGHIMFSYVALEGDESMRVLCLAPMAVAPGRQRSGIGSALVAAGLARADARGEPLVVVLGHAEYYPRFGFEPARSHGIQPPSDAIPDAVFMVKLLSRCDARYHGRIAYPPAFAAV
jgi:putative acetyltransferase